MKRFSLLKKLSILGSTVAAVTPIVVMATSCTPASMTIDAFDFDQLIKTDGLKLTPTNTVKNFRSLLYGSNAYYEGNYILFVGSNTFNNTCTFFGSNSGIRTKELWYNDNLADSYLYIGASRANLDDRVQPEGIKNFGVFNAIDFFNGKVYDEKGHQITVFGHNGSDPKATVQDCIGPFDKWSDDFIKWTKILNKSEDCPTGEYDWDDESVTKDDYIRNDEYAKQYRALCERGLLLYPKEEPQPDPEGSNERTITFDTDAGNKTSLMLVFCDGVLKSLENIPSTPDSFKETIVANFKKGEEDDPEELF